MTGKLADAVLTLRQAHEAANEADAPLGVESRVWEAHDGLDLVLQEMQAGVYAPSQVDAKAALELAADGAAFGWQANELQGLVRASLKGIAVT
jgi:hypothetical protein